jgi:hypothetical protein
LHPALARRQRSAGPAAHRLAPMGAWPALLLTARPSRGCCSQAHALCREGRGPAERRLSKRQYQPRHAECSLGSLPPALQACRALSPKALLAAAGGCPELRELDLQYCSVGGSIPLLYHCRIALHFCRTGASVGRSMLSPAGQAAAGRLPLLDVVLVVCASLPAASDARAGCSAAGSLSSLAHRAAHAAAPRLALTGPLPLASCLGRPRGPAQP